jgi:hypothetical protein
MSSSLLKKYVNTSNNNNNTNMQNINDSHNISLTN